MANKKYIDVSSGTPITSDIILVANPTTGALKRCTVAELLAAVAGDATPPTVSSATVSTPTPNQVVVVFSESVINVSSLGWSFKKNGAAWGISSVSGSGTTWTFTMSTSAANGDTLVRSYNAATGNTTDTVGNELGSFTDQSVTNSISGGDVTAPTVVSADTVNDNTIRIVFSESVTATTAGWSFKKNGSAWTLSSVSGSGTTWDFVMGTNAANGDTLLRSYDSATGATVDAAANELASFTDQAVDNNIAGFEAVVWTDATANITTGANGSIATTSNGTNIGARATKKLTGSFIIEGQFKNPYSGSDLAGIWLSSVNNTDFTTGAGSNTGIIGGFTVYTDDVYRYTGPDTVGSNSAIILTDGAANSMWVRIERSSNDLLYYTSPDGTTYTLRHTHTGAFTGLTECFIKFMNSGGTNVGFDQVRGQGLTTI